MSKINESNKSSAIIQSASMTCFDPELMDVGLDGFELYNRQLGRGQFRGELFRASLGSAVLDFGNYNYAPFLMVFLGVGNFKHIRNKVMVIKSLPQITVSLFPLYIC